ncbi:MAG: DNA starvation/stationary phase protection protein Dps [Propionibacteriaceae bacterium]|jgi:starvation-inducible DNA-binding protein|nr:DNA starvation/stationary phase protection protein Dps [Propionibacteriaceae bacterium]
MPSAIAGVTDATADKVVAILQQRLSAYNDLSLLLKHVHWNVVGPNFIAVHEMLDPQIDLVRGYADEAAERIATLGGTPVGLASAITSPLPYTLNHGNVQDHLAAVNKVYDIVIAANREAIDATEIDPVTQDLFIGATAELEKFQWFVRAHLQS